MSNRIMGVLLILLLLITAPYWVKGAKYIAGTIAGELEGIAQPSYRSQDYASSNQYVEVYGHQTYRRNYSFHASYSDDEGNYFEVDGTDRDYVYINGRVSNSLWAKIESFFRRLFGGASVRVDFRPGS